MYFIDFSTYPALKQRHFCSAVAPLERHGEVGVASQSPYDSLPLHLELVQGEGQARQLPFTDGNRKKSSGARSGELSGWGTSWMFFLACWTFWAMYVDQSIGPCLTSTPRASSCGELSGIFQRTDDEIRIRH
jgi:hypothetical protein